MNRFVVTIVFALYCIIGISARSCSEHLAPRHGYKGCTDHNNERSVCYFRCKPGYMLRGYETSRCHPIGFWIRSFPVCVKADRCSRPLKAPANGRVYCSLRSNGKHVCGFQCNRGYEMVGSRFSLCSYNRWSNFPPLCERVGQPQCDGILEAPENGAVSCEGSLMGNSCFFECNQGYVLEGSSSSVCVKTSFGSFWSKSSPTCKKQIMCPPLQNIENGGLMCSNSERGSNLCTVNCEPGFQILPSYNRQLQCLADGQWNATTPCCAVSTTCDISHRADIILAIDSSISFGEENIGRALEFTRDFIDSFSTAQENVTRFSVFRYSSEVDTSSQILLNNLYNRQQLLSAVQNIPNRAVEGTNTGVALRHIKNIMLSVENGNREEVQNIVILLTGSRSRDNVINPARKLRGKLERTNVYVAGFEPVIGNIDVSQLQSIVQRIQDFVFAEPGLAMNVLDQVLSRRFRNPLCRANC